MSWLERTELLLGEQGLANLSQANVLVVGLGGVGAYAAEMICRAGVGTMTIVDADVVAETNINRQLVALHSTIGCAKADILAKRLVDINPMLKLTVVEKYINDDATDELLDSDTFNCVVDAIDTLSPKVNLIAGAMSRGITVVSSMGAGAKIDPTRIEAKDISKSHHCPLALKLRKRLHKMGIRRGFTAVFSAEEPVARAVILCDEQNKKSNVGTISYMPAAFGIVCASVAINELRGDKSLSESVEESACLCQQG